MSEYYEEGGLLYERSPPMHIKVESPEGAFGGRVSEDGFPREDDDSEGSCDHAGLPFNVVVVHPNIVAPGVASDEMIPIQQSCCSSLSQTILEVKMLDVEVLGWCAYTWTTVGCTASDETAYDRGVSAALASGGAGKRKSRFSGAELEVLVSEVTRCEGELFGPAGRLRRRERERIWAGILERVNAVSRVPRTLREVKKRWDDLKRRNGGKLADARFRSWLPSSRGSAVLGGPSQLSPRFHQSRQKLSTRGKASFTCLSDTDPVTGGDGSERDGFEKEDESHEQDGDEGTNCDGVDNSMDDKLGLGLGLGIVPAATSERWLPPSPLYSAPFLNGTPQPSPEPSLGAHHGPIDPPPSRTSWLEDELRGLGEAAVQLGDRLEQNLREFGEGFRRDMRTLQILSQELEQQIPQNASEQISTAATSVPLPPDILDGTSQPESATEMNVQRPCRGRPGDHRRKRRH
ncbi:myb-related transcription factor, partner of profilin-like isoform X1 [Silurus meridionalis]|nr:myb-related transcription factor, partner of profilin-like isoform X1 [Silurus meridionalis]